MFENVWPRYIMHLENKNNFLNIRVTLSLSRRGNEENPFPTSTVYNHINLVDQCAKFIV